MSRLEGMHCVIAGGTGTVGEAIVQVFLREGATVIVPSRSQEAIDRLRGYLAAEPTDRLVTLVGNIGDAADAQRLRDEILARHPRLDAMVATLGGTWDEKLKLVDVPMETWRAYWESNLTPHFVAAKTFLPVLARRPSASYTLLGGISAVYQVPLYSVVSINSAAQLMLARYLIEEMKDTPVRIHQVMFGVIHTRARAAYARPEWITAEEVGRFCAYLASKEASMLSGGILQFGNRPA
jgi:NAD(P)-dependent dehydrogenase (short-subunit alcohol dehydrogenase family)